MVTSVWKAATMDANISWMKRASAADIGSMGWGWDGAGGEVNKVANIGWGHLWALWGMVMALWCKSEWVSKVGCHVAGGRCQLAKS